SANAEGRPRDALALGDVLVPIREVAGERAGGGEEPEGQGSEGTRLPSRTAECHRRTDGQDRAEREEGRDLPDSAVAELQGRRTVAPCEDRASKTEREQDQVRGDRDQSESRHDADCEAHAPRAKHRLRIPRQADRRAAVEGEPRAGGGRRDGPV